MIFVTFIIACYTSSLWAFSAVVSHSSVWWYSIKNKSSLFSCFIARYSTAIKVECMFADSTNKMLSKTMCTRTLRIRPTSSNKVKCSIKWPVLATESKQFLQKCTCTYVLILVSGSVTYFLNLVKRNGWMQSWLLP